MTQEQYATEMSTLRANFNHKLGAILAAMAYDRGHAYGYEEVVVVMGNLVEELRPVNALLDECLRSMRMAYLALLNSPERDSRQDELISLRDSICNLTNQTDEEVQNTHESAALQIRRMNWTPSYALRQLEQGTK